MGQNVKSPFSNIRAVTFKLRPRSSRIAVANCSAFPAAKSPIAPAAPPSLYLPTRFRALALFGRRPPERMVRSSLPAAENLRTSGHRPRLFDRQSDLASRPQVKISYPLHSRKYNPKNRTLRISRRDDELASVTLDDHPANSQPQSHPVRLCCEEGVK
jgi:hypothetical protein